MFIHELERAASTAPRIRLPEIAKAVWKAYAEGLVGEGDAQRLAELIEARKTMPTPEREPRKPRKPVRQGSRPKTADSLARRRRWVASGLLPPQVACRFTMGEQAVLAVVAAETKRRGDCRLTIGNIAALAGVSATTVRNAMRQAADMEILTVTERRLTAWRNDSNVVTVTSREWRSWLSLRPAGGGYNSVKGTPTVQDKRIEAGLSRSTPRAFEGMRGRYGGHVTGGSAP